MPTEPEYLKVVEAMMGEEDLVYDTPISCGPHTCHVHHTNDGPVVRVVTPMSADDGSSAARDLAYNIATSLLSETTNNDACDVTVRERSAHFHSHEDLNYLDLDDNLTVVVVDAYISDCLT